MSVDVAFVLLESVDTVDATKIVEAAAAMGAVLSVEPSEAPEGPLVFGFEGGKLLVMPIDVPHPDVPHMALGPLSPPREAMEAASAHLIVTVMGLEGPALGRDTITAALCGAVAQGCGAVAAMLGHGVVFHRADVFAELAAQALGTENSPFEILVDVTAAPEGEERMSLLSHGMVRYGREEFYLTCPIEGQGAMGFMFSLVRWLLTDREKQLPTGDTIGRTPEEKLTVQRVPNPTGKGPQVIRLDL